MIFEKLMKIWEKDKFDDEDDEFDPDEKDEPFDDAIDDEEDDIFSGDEDNSSANDIAHIEDIEDTDTEDEKEEKNELPEVDKEYFGSKDIDSFYLVRNRDDSGEMEDLEITSADGTSLFSAKQQDLDFEDVTTFVEKALEEIDVDDISYEIVIKYFVRPREEEIKMEDEIDLEDTEEDMVEDEDMDFDDFDTDEEEDIDIKKIEIPVKSKKNESKEDIECKKTINEYLDLLNK